MANTARFKDQCYINIKGKCRVYHFTYSMWQENDLSVIKNSLNIHWLPLSIPSFPTLIIKLHRIWTMLGFILTPYYLIQCWKGWEIPFESLPVLCHTHIQFYKWIVWHCSYLVLLYKQHSTILTFDPPMQSSLYRYKCMYVRMYACMYVCVYRGWYIY